MDVLEVDSGDAFDLVAFVTPEMAEVLSETVTDWAAIPMEVRGDPRRRGYADPDSC
jgi:hypothetical protein